MKKVVLVGFFFIFLRPAVFTVRAAPAYCPAGDLNGDCRVDAEDLMHLARRWLDASGDVDGLERVDFVDFSRLAAQWRMRRSRLLISEFMASNHSEAPLDEGELLDEDGDSSDWIEIHNPTESVVDLDGWYLTDDPNDLTRWRLPVVSLDAGAYLVVFASRNDRRDPAGELHTNFKLDAGGEYLALIEPDGLTVAHGYGQEYPKQLADISYGLVQHESNLVSPGASASYRVPTAPDAGTDWTGRDFDDGTWHKTVTLEQADVVITEIEAGQTDWVEIQNVSGRAVDTSGWAVLFNDASAVRIEDVAGVLWDLPPSIAAGEVLYVTDNVSDNYVGGDIRWDDDKGWAAVVDQAGGLVDFVVWGYTEAEIESAVIITERFGGIAAPREWSGQAASMSANRWGQGLAGTDVGDPRLGGSYTVDVDTGVYSVSGGGADIWGGSDQFYFAYQPFEGDVHVAARVNGMDNTHSWAKAGVMIRESLDADSTNVMVDVTSANGVSMQRRRSTGAGGVHTTTGNLSAPYWVKLVREGDTFAGYRSPDGQAWTLIDTDTISMTGQVYVGLAVTSHNDSGPLCGAEFQYVSAGRSDPSTILARHGDSDGNRREDIANPASATKGVQNPGLSVPFVEVSVEVATGIGFGGGESELGGVVETDVTEAMRGANGSLWCRLEFTVEEPDWYDALTLRMKYDDGFVAYLNGTEVGRRNLSQSASWDSFADGDRADALATEYVSLDISGHVRSLVEGRNVLAIHGLNAAGDDGDFLILPELTASATRLRFEYMTSPTPQSANVAGAVGMVADTRFSIDRGFYSAPFEAVISSDTEGAEIYYTTDGERPAPDSQTATLYTSPIAIDRTTVLRAAAFKAGYLPTNVDTQTYIFCDDVVRQNTMSTVITEDPVWGPQVIKALMEIPSVSLVTPHTISEAEKEVSIELIFPDGTTGFQVDAGVEHFGGHSLGYPKKNMRISFKRIYGPSRLRYNLFAGTEWADGAADEFDQILLRTGSHDTMFWTQPGTGARGVYVRNRWIMDRQLEMGQPAPRGRFVHVYINGVYWGLHHLMERPNAAFMAGYFGGDKSDYDTVKGNWGVLASIDGDLQVWNAMLASTSDYSQLGRYMDVGNYADYMLLNFYVGNDWDWKHYQNWMAARKRQDGAGYKFFCWDNDVCLRTSPTANVVNRGGPGNMWGAAKQHQAFLELLAERAGRYYFDGGMLTEARVIAQFDALAARIEKVVIPECARWGVPKGYTPTTWRQSVDWIQKRFVPGRTELVIEQMRNAGVLPR